MIQPYIYIYIYIYIPAYSNNGYCVSQCPWRLDFYSKSSHTKDSKMVVGASLHNTQRCKV